MRREHQQKKVLHEIKGIFIDSFDMTNVNDSDPILEQLVHIAKKVADDESEANDKLLQWSKRKFETKVLNKVSVEIAIKQVELSTLVSDTKEVVLNAQSLYKKV